ncbi:hypothetical protein LC612_39215 [Nostoc sp. CHAB 5834]|nr:hypothetical protein [Nostoc sp. CHAB 5834]
MKLSNQQLINFVNTIKFSTTDKSYYKDQIENLIEQVDLYLTANSTMSVKKVIQCGSWRKSTILRPNLNNILDIDLAFYIDISKIEDINDFHELNSKIVELLIKIYPTKSKDDFKENVKTANVKFLTSGLSVDIVPVIDVPPGKVNGLSNYVYQPDSKTYNFYITSIRNQINFIVERKKDNTSFTSIVRILKEWKNVKNLNLSSFSIELIISYLDLSKGVITNIEEALLRFFTLISNKNFPKIIFNAPYGEVTNDGSVVYITDPTNKSNNVTKYISAADWKVISNEAEKALDTLSYAQEKTYIGDTIGLWKEIFDSSFTITSVKV